MKFTPAGIALLKECEGCALQAYPDPVTKADPWTIGYGHTANVSPGMKITQADAETYLGSDIMLFSSRVMKVAHPSLNDNQFTASVCFAYNMREWASTPLFYFLASGNVESAKAHWLLYDHATVNGVKIEVPGLKTRRQKELELFCTT